MQLGHARPELNHGEGGGVTEVATEQVVTMVQRH